MTEKQQRIVQIVSQMRQYQISLEELADAFSGGKSQSERAQTKPARNTGEIFMKLFSYLGGVFVFAGVGIYIGSFWDNMNSFTRILVTLGTGIGLTILSIIAQREQKYPGLIFPLTLVAILVQTSGWFVFIYEIFSEGGDPRKAEMAVSAVMAVQLAFYYQAFRTGLLAFWALFFFYGFLAVTLDLMEIDRDYISLVLGGSLLCLTPVIGKLAHRGLFGCVLIVGGLWFNAGVYSLLREYSNTEMAAMVTGLSLLSLGYGIVRAGAGGGFWYLIGSAIIFDALFAMVKSTPFELLYLGVAAFMMYLSTLLQSRAILFTSVIAMLGFIGYFTTQHFLNSVGWPITLIFLGLTFFGVSALAFRIKRRYL